MTRVTACFITAVTAFIGGSSFAQPDYNIEHLATRMFTIFPSDGVIRDSLIYLVGEDPNDNARFAVYDISTPTAPVERGYAILPFAALSIILDEDIAFIMHPAGVAIFDIRDPWHIQSIDSIEVEPPFSMALRDNVLYVSRSENLLNIYSFSGDNHQVELLNEVDVGDTLRCMTTYEDKLLTGGRRFKVYSLDDPAEPRLIGTVDSTTYDIVVKNNHAYVARFTEGVSIYRLSNEGDPEFISRLGINYALGLTLWQGNLVVGQHILWDGENNPPTAQILTYDLTNPAVPRYNGFFDREGGFFRFEYQPAMCAGESPVCFIFDEGIILSNQHIQNGHYIPQYSNLGAGGDRSIVMAGGYLYVLRPQGSKILYCFDISDGGNPVQISAQPKDCYLVAGSDHHLFTWESPRYGRSELRAYEVGEGGSLRQVGALAEPNVRASWHTYKGVINNGFLICDASSFNGFVAIDIQNPTRMRNTYIPAQHDFSYWAFDHDRQIIYARTNDWEDQQFDDGIMRLDISDLSHPVEHDRVLVGPKYYSLTYDSNRLYLVERIGLFDNVNDSIRVADIDNQDNIHVIASYRPENFSRLIMVEDNRMYFTSKVEGQSGIMHIWDVSNLETPIEIGSGEAEGYHIQSIILDGLYITNQIYSVGFYDISRALSVSDELPVILHPSSLILSVHPNPFNSSTTISFSVQQASPPVRLAIYDLQGRLVADLLNGRGVLQYAPTAGQHKVVWDAGNLGSGVYFVRLGAGTQTVMRKIILIR